MFVIAPGVSSKFAACQAASGGSTIAALEEKTVPPALWIATRMFSVVAPLFTIFTLMRFTLGAAKRPTHGASLKKTIFVSDQTPTVEATLRYLSPLPLGPSLKITIGAVG